MNEIMNSNYLTDLQEIKNAIRKNQNKAMVIANSAMIMTYYEIGTIINKRKSWGNKYIQKLSNDLKEYGKGYSYENLHRMARFSSEFSYEEIMSQPATQIPWFTTIIIISKSKSHDEILWYINEAYENGWSRSTVLKQFEAKAYERSLLEPSSTPSIREDDRIEGLFKDTYVFRFLDKESIKKESNLKNTLLNNVICFLHELGPGFALIDKEYKLVTPSKKTYYIDLLMYHTKIHCYIVIELKIGEFEPSDLGQLMFYVGAINKLEKTFDDNDTIGLLLCKDADSFTAKTTLELTNSKIGISRYKILEELPDYLEKRLKER